MITLLLALLLGTTAPPATAPVVAASPPAPEPPAATSAPPFPAPDCGLVPGWTTGDEARRYNVETLFEYKNGAAEAYFSYGFVQMQGVTCADARGVELVIDVSELGDPDHAWGFFMANHDPQAPAEAVGSARQVLPTSAALAQDRFYVEITAQPDGDHRAALAAFLDALLPRIPGRGQVPEAVSCFPAEGLEPGSARLVPESVLGLRLLASGFVARYGVGRAFIVPAPSPEAAIDTFSKLRTHFGGLEAAPALGKEAFTARDPYLDGVVAFRRGRYVAGVANVVNGQNALPLATALASRLPE